MDTQLYINSNLVDLYESERIALNFTLNDVKEIFKRNSNYSKNFKVPHTDTNKVIFEDIFNINVNNNVWNVGKINAVLYNGGDEVFRGFVSLTNIVYDNDKIEYEIKLLGELKGLFFDMIDNKIEDLVWDSSTEHSFDLSNAQYSNWNADLKPWFYPLLDYGGFITGITNDYSLKAAFTGMNGDDMNEYFRPAVFIKSIIDNIFETYGYTYECDIFHTPWFKNLFIPYNNDVLSYEDGESLFFTGENLSFTANKDSVVIDGFPQELPQLPTKFTYISLNETFDIFSGWDNSITYTIEKSGNMRIYFSFDVYSIIATKKGNESECQFSYLLVGEDGRQKQYGEVLLFDITNVGDTISGKWDFNVEKGDKLFIIILRPEDIIYLDDRPFNRENGLVTLNNIDINYKYIDYNQATFGLSNKLKVSDYISKNIKQKDLIISILQMFNLYIEVDKFNSSNYIIKPRDDFYFAGEERDWTEKLLPDFEINNNLIPYDFNQFSFNFLEEDDYHSNLYTSNNDLEWGSKEITGSNIYSTNKKDINLIFAGTPFISGIDDTSNTYSTIISNGRIFPTSKLGWIDSSGSDGYIIGDVIKKPNYKIKTRILMKWTYPSIPGLTLKNYTGIDTTDKRMLTYSTGVQFDFGKTLGEIDLSFRQCFYNYDYDGTPQVNNMTNLYNYWSNNLNNTFTKDSRILSAYFNLGSKDISQLSLRDKIYCDFGGTIGSGWFLINKIVDYDPSKVETRVELIKVIDPSYLGIDYLYKPLAIEGENFITIDAGSDNIDITSDTIQGGEDEILVGNTIDGGENNVFL